VTDGGRQQQYRVRFKANIISSQLPCAVVALSAGVRQTAKRYRRRHAARYQRRTNSAIAWQRLGSGSVCISSERRHQSGVTAGVSICAGARAARYGSAAGEIEAAASCEKWQKMARQHRRAKIKRSIISRRAPARAARQTIRWLAGAGDRNTHNSNMARMTAAWRLRHTKRQEIASWRGAGRRCALSAAACNNVITLAHHCSAGGGTTLCAASAPHSWRFAPACW